jgi:nitrogen regulatory protein PII
MIYMILFVLHDPDKLTDLLDSWDQAGVSGITILPSTGIGKLKGEDILREDMPLIPSLEDILQTPEKSNRTLFTLIEGEEMIDKIVEATEAITGDLEEPNTGILTVIPVAKTYGLHRKNGQNSHG